MTTQKDKEKNSSGHSEVSQDHQGMPPIRRHSKPRFNILLARLLLVILAFTLATFVMSAYRGSARKQSVPVITLQSSERILEDVPFISALAPTSSMNDKQIYVLRRDTPKITVYDVERKRSEEIVPLGPAAKALAISSQGRMYLASDSELRVIDRTGRSLATFPIPNPSSLATSANGDVVVSSTDSGKLLHVYDQAGSRLRGVGELKRFDTNNPAQNNFLNRGKVLVGPSGAFYYVSVFAPVPTVQKFSSEGKFLLEFAIEGNAVDLQLEHAREFLRSKKVETIGGFHVITSAAIDPVTGHLWVGLNGSSTHGRVSPGSGVAYEYDSNGVKLAEYAFLLNPPLTTTGVITDLRDITVNAPWIHVLTSQGQVYRFNMNGKLARHNAKRKTEYNEALNSSARTFWSAASAPASVAMTQESCPAEQPFTCVANCPSGSSPTTQDCAAEIKKRLSQGDRIISNSCNISQQTPGGCSASATSCNTSTGVQVSLSVSLNCNAAPTPTPTPTPTEEGGGGNPCESEGHFAQICGSPIVIDVADNGFDLTNAASGANFDLNSDGTRERLSWTAVGSDDAWLVLDRNGNGTIDNGTELFGNFTPQPVSANPNGFLALAEFDKLENGGNGNGFIDNRDAIFSSLRLWQDINHNGFSESAELHTLPEFGVSGIELNYKESRRRDQYGNEFRYRAKLVGSSPFARYAWDVFLTFW